MGEQPKSPKRAAPRDRHTHLGHCDATLDCLDIRQININFLGHWPGAFHVALGNQLKCRFVNVMKDRQLVRAGDLSVHFSTCCEVEGSRNLWFKFI